MAGNGGGSSSRGGGASINAAATAVGSGETRIPPVERRTRWRGCFGGLSCFGSQKGGKRIVPASRIPEGNASVNRVNGAQTTGLSNQNTTLTPSLLAPPSSPASFTNSALPSTVQSPSCFLSMSANSPGGPSSTMFATGPYAHETQLVSPPVFSTYTTEPSTAPLTPPPELAHLTTPSSPDVPFARFLSSSMDLKGSGKVNEVPFLSSSYTASSDLQVTYPLYPGSPSSSLISPASGTPRTGVSSPFPEQEISTQWGSSFSGRASPYSRNSSSKLFGVNSGTSRNFMLSSDSSFLCPATSAHFYLDQAQQSLPPYTHCGGRLSVSKEADMYSSGGNRHSKTCKQDVEEIEAYRASFGFSADEIITTQNYVEITDVLDDSFTMSPFPTNEFFPEQCPVTELAAGHQKMESALSVMLDPESPKMAYGVNAVDYKATSSCNIPAGSKPDGRSDSLPLLGDSESTSMPNGGDDMTFKIPITLVNRRIRTGESCSDAEIDYRRVRSLKEANRILAWQNSLP
ncbi:hypothetical protein J5N97_005514 [Dioscorea zingiberensis]|uniref:Hydroxyproline-rich glycoprotein family protein n=1 Tax=Dioscorea zingiberensis TaxID=325984 RepID=A0A9D5DAE5_9LILI|nr:hypothetical protein J5N97_005514 [Dioscorea zingiberensis]